MALLSNLINVDDIGALAEGGDEFFERAYKNVTLKVNSPILQKSEFAGETITSRITLLEAPKLNYVSLKEQSYIDPDEHDEPTYFVCEGYLTNVKLDIELRQPDGSYVPLLDEVLDILNAAGMTTNAALKFLEDVNLIPDNGRMTYWWQQMGTNVDAYKDLIKTFVSEGAENNWEKQQRPDTLRSCYKHNSGGVEVVSFEVGQANRDANKRSQGFIGFVPAYLEQIQQFASIKKNIDALRAKREGASGNQIKAIDAKMAPLTAMRDASQGNWAGRVQSSKIVDGKVEMGNAFHFVKANTGRFTLNTAEGDKEFSLWKNNDRSNTQSNLLSESKAEEIEFDLED